MPIDEAAKVFGSDPDIWGVQLAPDGLRVSALTRHATGIPVVMIIDLAGAPSKLILASDEKKKMDIRWCNWANDTRLLCGYYGLHRYKTYPIEYTRLVAVNDDGSNQQVLAQRQQRDTWSNHQDEIIDYLPNDREHILMEVRKGDGEGVSKVNIYKNKTTVVERARDNVWDWRSDGRGNLRLRNHSTRRKRVWQYRVDDKSKWKSLYEYDPDDHTEEFAPLGYGDDPTQIYTWGRHEGRIAIFSIDLKANPGIDDLKQELVHSHPTVDLTGFVRIGRRNRLIGVSYSTDKPYTDYFDETIRKVNVRVSALLPDMGIDYVEESWDRRFYLIYASSDLEPGTYYRFDAQTNQLDKLVSTYSQLEDVSLSPMTPIEYPSDDGVMIPSYISRPADGATGPRPLIILPHGGPSARDHWGFDWLPQFLSARGYVVLQSNYRGSSGYG